MATEVKKDPVHTGQTSDATQVADKQRDAANAAASAESTAAADKEEMEAILSESLPADYREIHPVEGVEQIEHWMIPLAKEWKAHDRVDLKLRWKTGFLLNYHLGPPTERQPRGERTLETFAAIVRKDKWTLSRCRWLAFHFKTSSSFEAKFREHTTWTEAVAEVTRLNKELKAKSAESADASDGESQEDTQKKEAAFRDVLSSLKKTIEKVRGSVDYAPNQDQREELEMYLGRFAREAEAVLGIELKSSEKPREAA